MRTLGLLLITTLYSGLAFGDPGFVRLPFPEITEAARTSAASVFEIHRFDPDSRLTIDLQSFGKAYETKIKQDGLPPRAERAVLLQLELCRTRKQSKACELYTSTEHASAFLIGDGRTLMTVLPFYGKQAPVAVYNGRGDLVYMGPGEVEPCTTNPYSGLNVVRVRLQSDLGQPLVAATAPAPVRTKVYVAGFPAGTGKYRFPGLKKPASGLGTRNPLPESKGDGIFISFGTVSESAASGIFHTDADSNYGSQGGPVLNGAGEVLGINLGGEVELQEAGSVVRIRQSTLPLSAKLLGW